MSTENHEQRIAALEELVRQICLQSPEQARMACLQIEQTLIVADLNTLTLRLMLESGMIQNETIRTKLTDAIAKSESRRDQLTAVFQGIRAALPARPG